LSGDQGQGEGQAARPSIGARALLVHALDDQAAGFYLSMGFPPSTISQRTLMLQLLKSAN
jgi:hypothetical protein